MRSDTGRDLRGRHGPRDLTVLHPALAARYVRVVAAVAPTIEAHLSPAVAANRVSCSSIDPPALRLRPFARERAAFRRRLAALAARQPHLLFADVRACFPSIGPDVVARALRSAGCGERSVAGVVGSLRRLEDSGVRGLPVGPDPSAVLANAVLAAVDRSIEAVGLPHLRWVDDLVVGVRDPAEADRVLRAVSPALAEAGLELNGTKTRLVTGPGPVALPTSLGRSLPLGCAP